MATNEIGATKPEDTRRKWAGVLSILLAFTLVGTLLGWRNPPIAGSIPRAKPTPGQTSRTLLVAHYMPWFANKSVSGKWGWHWTMNHFNPDSTSSGRSEAASHFRPMIGLYDSSDPDTLEYEALLMKLAGFDAVAIDWYGLEDYYDYASNHRNSQLMVKELQKVGLKFTIVYEDATVAQLIKGKVYAADAAVEKGREVFKWLAHNWFCSPSFLKLEDRPVALVFGPQYYKDEDWPQIFGGLDPKPEFFTLMFKRGPAAVGGFAWPTPQKGEASSWNELDLFEKRAGDWQHKVEVAYPRFEDIYGEAGSQPSFPVIPDHEGQTYQKTISRALATRPAILQVATWNDWGEGTQIEPSIEFGYRDLEVTQNARRSLGSFGYSAEDLRLPFQIYQLRKQFRSDSQKEAKLDAVVNDIISANTAQARKKLARL